MTLDFKNYIEKRLNKFRRAIFLQKTTSDLKKYNFESIKKPKASTYCLFKYMYPYINTGINLGDYVQTIATKNALESISLDNQYIYSERDLLFNYDDVPSVVVMQGWFAHLASFLPNNNLVPVWLGTHFNTEAHKTLEIEKIKKNLQKTEVGCRDDYTYSFCKKNNIPSYFSRCLTLTFPLREKTKEQRQVYIVDVPKKYFEYIPEHIRDSAKYISQRHIPRQNNKSWQDYAMQSEKLLSLYKDTASLVITRSLHCASPCIAMGIPVILISEDVDCQNRFGSLKNIFPISSPEDFMNNKVDFRGNVVDIEPLKVLMLKNLKLSIDKNLGKKIDENEILNVREKIASFSISREECLKYL